MHKKHKPSSLLKVWPDQPKVIGAQHLAGDFAAGLSLNGHANDWAEQDIRAGRAAQVALGGVTAHGKCLTRIHLKAIEVGE